MKRPVLLIIILFNLTGLVGCVNENETDKIETKKQITTEKKIVSKDKLNDNSNPDVNLDTQSKTIKEILLNSCNFNLDTTFKKDNLEALSKDQLVILRNAIYAKHGYIFSKKKYYDYFTQFDWYTPTSTNVSQLLTSIDKDNIEKIIQLEKRLENLHYKNSKLGFSITFPKSWSGKYRIDEHDTYLIVYFKPSKKMDFKGGEFFLIVDAESEVFYQDTYDTVVDIDESFFIANNHKYFIGGPTDFPVPEDHPELDLYLKMKSSIPDIIKTIQPLN